MEAGLGIPGSVAGIIQLAAAIIKQLDDLRGASDEVRHVTDNVQSLADVLESIRDIFDNHQLEIEAQALTKSLGTYVKGCERTLESMRQILHSFSSRGIKTTMGRIEWARKKGQMRTLHSRLTEGKVTLMLVLTALNG